jgi:hypothetical protein
VAKVYIVSFRTHNDDRPSKFIVVANDRKQAINMAWEHGGPDFQARFDKSTAQATEMTAGALCAFCEWWKMGVKQFQRGCSLLIASST